MVQGWCSSMGFTGVGRVPVLRDEVGFILVGGYLL